MCANRQWLIVRAAHWEGKCGCHGQIRLQCRWVSFLPGSFSQGGRDFDDPAAVLAIALVSDDLALVGGGRMEVRVEVGG